MTKNEITQAILNAWTQHTAYTERLSSSAVNEILRAFDKLSNAQLRELRELLESLTVAELQALKSNKYTTPALKEIRDVMAEWVEQISTQLPLIFESSATALMAYEVAYIYQLADKKAPAINGESLYSKAKTLPYAKGNLLSYIFPQIGQKLRSEAEKLIRDGISNNLTTQQIIQQIKGTKANNYKDGLLNISREHIDAEVKTARAHLSSEAYANTWKALGFGYVKDVATLDGRTTPQCAFIDGRVQKLDDKTKRPPYHFRCRTKQIGCTKDGDIDGVRPYVMDDQPVSKIPKDQRDGKIGTIDADTTFEKFFNTVASEKFKRDWLGETRYKLHKEGKFPITKFIDPLSGKLFTLENLREKDNETFKELGL